MAKLCCVYWIHLPEHSDITTQGYIGISTRPVEDRFKEHISTARGGKTILSNALNKHKDKVVVTTLLKGSVDYCLIIEAKLRQEDRIGWNTVKGGGKPPIFAGHSEESKKKIGEGAKRTSQSPAHKASRIARKGVKRSEESKVKMRKKAQGRLPWETSRANKEVWKIADKVYFVYQANISIGHIALEKFFNLPKRALKAMVEKFKKKSWNPNQDVSWLLWVKNINTLNKETSC